jgi:hypothetical protein
MYLTLEGPCIIFLQYKKKLLMMDRYGPKHVELTPEY